MFLFKAIQSKWCQDSSFSRYLIRSCFKDFIDLIHSLVWKVHKAMALAAGVGGGRGRGRELLPLRCDQNVTP
jgi:hypothetical protein